MTAIRTAVQRLLHTVNDIQHQFKHDGGHHYGLLISWVLQWQYTRSNIDLLAPQYHNGETLLKRSLSKPLIISCKCILRPFIPPRLGCRFACCRNSQNQDAALICFYILCVRPLAGQYAAAGQVRQHTWRRPHEPESLICSPHSIGQTRIFQTIGRGPKHCDLLCPFGSRSVLPFFTTNGAFMCSGDDSI